MSGREITYRETNDLRSTIEYFYYLEDETFHKEVHKKGGSIEENIKDTINSIAEKEQVFEIYVGDELAAFFTKFVHKNGVIMNSFHILKKYRGRYFIKRFWDIVRDELGELYYTSICVKNLPAIAHLIKNGFVKINEVLSEGNKFVVLEKAHHD